MRVLLRVLIVAAVVIALIAVETTSRSGVLWRLTTFTYQANVLAAVYYLVDAVLCHARMAAPASGGRLSCMSLSQGSFGTCC